MNTTALKRERRDLSATLRALDRQFRDGEEWKASTHTYREARRFYVERLDAIAVELFLGGL